MRCLLPLLAVAAVFAADTPAPATPPAPLRVFIRSGPKTHGPGDHDHPSFLRDWVPFLTAAGMKVAGSNDTFPTAEQLAATDVVIIHRQTGGDFKPAEKEIVDAYAKRGGGFVVIHAATVAGGDASVIYYKDLIGGSWRQKVTKWKEGPMELRFVRDAAGATHDPITHGVADFTMKDEIYYDMDLRDDIHAIAVATTPKKGEKPDIQTQIWTYEKSGAQRAVGFIPGHTYANFNRPDMKLLLLRSIAWAGRRDVNTYDKQAQLEICPVFDPAKAAVEAPKSK